MVRGMRGISLQEVVCMVNLARLHCRVVGGRYHDHQLGLVLQGIAQDSHPLVHAHIGLCKEEHLLTNLGGYLGAR